MKALPSHKDVVGWSRHYILGTRNKQLARPGDLIACMQVYRGVGTGGAGGARAPPRIEYLESKIFENSQNVIFLIIWAP